uniref:Myosin IXAb n=1 Tax=Astyanax mexicanus TaxID=7994 RepID=A0A8B9LK76_ASTMX
MSCHDAGGRRRFEDTEFTLHIYPGTLSEGTIYCPVSARKVTSAAEVIEQVIERLRLDRARLYVLAEVKEFGGEEWILNPGDCPVQRMMLWPRMALENRISGEDYRFLLREKNLDGSIHYGSLQMWLRVTEERRRLVERGLLPQPPAGQLASDLCALPDLNERTLLENLRGRFRQEKIYTYVGGILIVVNPFKFLPIYNPKYVKMYDNHQLGKLEPHIYAVADVAYHAMLQRRRNQCIVISGESGSGKTQSTNFLIHHLTALSQKGFASGVEQIILGAGPVLEAFGNAKTAHNNNSSRFGKFIQVNYQESGTVRGAYVEKYLLEKSRLVYQEHNERNYHVFYYLLAGASEEERKAFHLLRPEEYHYLNQDCFSVEGEDLKHDFERLQLAMEMVGFLPATRKQILSLLSAILLLGNIRYKKKTYRDDSIDICNPEVLPTISELLEVKYAGTVRDSMAKSLYGALFDWIVFRTNHALLNNKDLEDSILSIGVLDIFGFEDYENNSFEQFCINFANERLQHYFNQHIFKLEQEEYRAEGISWHMIDYIDNTSCINLISKKPTALLHLLDEECNFPQASNQTLLDKFKRQHDGNSYIEFPAVMEPAFIIHHYAGKVKYSVKDFREKNTDHMRPDIVALLKSSKSAFICGLMGIDPVATFRWAVLRAYFRAVVAFRGAGKWHREKKSELQGQAFPSEVYAVLNIKCLRYFRCTSHAFVCWFIYFHSLCVQHLLDVKSLKHLSSLTLHDRITKSLLHLHKKKKPPSISAQFQSSLNKLMETLGQSEPYFVKCIRSNAEKLPLRFNDALVLRQLRYTGMLETVRIRQSGYSVKYTFQDFAHHFHVLLPDGTGASQAGIREFLKRADLDPDGYQVGKTMVFLREVQRQRLQDLLHQEVLRRIVMLQRKFRALLERKLFINQRQAALVIQVQENSRVYRALQRAQLRHGAAVCLQAAWRGYEERKLYLLQRGAVLLLQRGWRRCMQRRWRAAGLIQATWRAHRQRQRYLQLCRAIITLQAACRGHQARQSHGSFELLIVDDAKLEELDHHHHPDLVPIDQSISVEDNKREHKTVSEVKTTPVKRLEPSSPIQPAGQRTSKALFYISDEGSSPVSPEPQTPSRSKAARDRKESVVVLISMQKESPVDPSSLEALERLEQEAECKPNIAQQESTCSSIRFGQAPLNQPTVQPSQAPLDLRLNLELSSGAATLLSGSATREASSEARKEEGMGLMQAQKKAVMHSISISMKEKSCLNLCCPLQVEEHMGHIFKSTQYSIPTYCEYCSSLIWMMDRACVLCRYACHRKCCLRMTTKCSKKFDPEQSSRQFGVELSRLTSDERAVPLVVEKLINYIEMHGLYTEGIYRKSGSTNKIKELKLGLDTDANTVNLDDYNIHVIASVLKQWLRDLPNPLMTFELYDEFLRATGLQDKREVVKGVYTVIDQLSRTHLGTLERLIFHLVRISLQEETNRMSANALAIVFAPCILRCPDSTDPLQSVQDIGKTTACVEMIICQQMNKYKARLKDINTLEFAESKAKNRLTHIRRSMVRAWIVKSQSKGQVMLLRIHRTNPAFPSPTPLLTFPQKPVLIAVRFMSMTRTATPVCMQERCDL